jgi:hypothetical protein
MQHQITRTAFGQVLGHPTKPHLRFFMPPPEGEGAGGAGAGGDGGQGGAGGAGAGGEGGEQPLSAEDAKAIRKTADKAMQERNTARDEAKKFTDLGVTPEQVAQWKADAERAAGGPTPEQIQKDADKRAEQAAAARYAEKARTTEVRTQAAALGFHDPADALALIPPAELAKVTVDDNLDADGAAVRTLLEAIAKTRPYLVKSAGQQTADYRLAGIGGAGSGTRPEPAPGIARMAASYGAPAGG